MLTQTGWVAGRSYVMQFMFPDDIAPLRRLLELIQVDAPPPQQRVSVAAKETQWRTECTERVRLQPCEMDG
jgi:hypothetical protein